MNGQKVILILLSGALLWAVSAGCNNMNAARSMAAYDRWEKASARVKLSAASALYEENKLPEAENLLNQSLQVNPASAQAHLLKGKICFMQDKIDIAEQSFQTAVNLDSKLDHAWYYLGLIARRRGQLSNAAGRRKGKDGEPLLPADVTP